MPSLQALSQAINAAAMDECGAAQALVNLGGDAISSMLGMDASQGQSEFGTWVSYKASALTMGVQKFNEKLNQLQRYQFCGGFANHSDLDRCANFVDITGSLWEKAKNADRTTDNVPDDAFVNLARALFGEMIILPSAASDSDDKNVTMFSVNYYEPCSTTTARVVIADMLGTFATSGEPAQAQTPSSITRPVGNRKRLSLRLLPVNSTCSPRNRR